MAAIAAALLLGACASEPPALGVDRAWLRLPAVPGRPAAAYFTIHGGTAPTALVAVNTDIAIETQLHESMAGGMRQLASVPIPADTDIAFAPGGRHAMLFNVNPGVKPGRIITLTFTFANGQRLSRKATAVAAGTPGPG